MSDISKLNFIFALSIILLLVFSACAGLTKRLESPTVHIADIRVQEIKPLEASFHVQLRVLNPNDIPIRLKGITCDVELDDMHLATGVSDAAVEIPAFGNALVPIEVFSSAFDVVKAVFALNDKEKTYRYKINGRLRLEGGAFILSSIPFKSEGDLNIKGLMDKQ